MLAVEGLEHHKALVALEGLFDMGNACLHPCRLVPLLALERVGAAVERQHQKIDRQAQKDDRNPVVADQTVRNRENHFKHQLQRPDQQPVERRSKTHAYHPLCLPGTEIAVYTNLI